MLVAISFLLRTGALHMYYWADEGISVGISSHPLSQLPSLLRQDGAPPLYYALLHLWMQVFGRDPQATHALSLVFALATIPAAYWTGASLFGRRAGAICAVLAAGLPYLTSFGQETRMYSLLALLSLLLAVSFVHVFVHRNRRYLPLLVGSLTAALYTHNWALFLGLICFFGWLVLVRASEERASLIRDGAIVFGVTAILYLPWVPTLLDQAKHTGAPWALPPNLWSLPQGAYFLTGGRAASVALALAAGAGLLGAKRLTLGQTTQLALASLALLGFGTALLAWVYAKTTPAWAFRYLAVILGPLLLLFSAGLARAARLGLTAVALVCCFWVLDPTPAQLDAKSNVGSAARVVRASAGLGALVLSPQPEQVPAIDYYLPRAGRFVTPLGPVPDPRVVNWRDALPRLRRAAGRSVLVSALSTLTPGQRVVLVAPVLVPRTPLWLGLIRRISSSWSSYLERDSNLRLVSTSSPHQYSSSLPVRISVYAQRP